MVIQAVMAVAFACAFAFALCLPSGMAFAEGADPSQEGAVVGDGEDADSAEAGEAQQVTAEPQNPSPDGADARLVANAIDDSSDNVADDAAHADGASSDSDDTPVVVQNSNIPEEWYKSFWYERDDAAGTITLKCLDISEDADIYVGKTATIDGKTYTTIIDNYYDDEAIEYGDVTQGKRRYTLSKFRYATK